jgi:endonuclease/exonuclease/phosphatase family metal-dependent hydrolase
MGDLNCNTSSEALQKVSTALTESSSVATVSETTGIGSSHSLGQPPAEGKQPIDYVFVTSESIDVYTHKILTGGQNVLDSTDHCPVICDVTIN